MRNADLARLCWRSVRAVRLRWLDLTNSQTLGPVLPPVVVSTVLFARHAEAIFLTVDRYPDPRG